MPTLLSPKEFLEQAPSGVLFDVRSEGEYTLGHIPGAVSLPLFSDEERAVVGTRYVKVSRESAILKGLEYVGPKLKELAQTALKTLRKAGNNRAFLYCWRGGMRSGSLGWLLNMLGIEVFLIRGGYKAYRTYGRELMAAPFQLQIIGGYTGSGKTELLNQMRQQGFQVIDLEALASHKGSAFGAIGQEVQPSSEQFENLLTEQLRLFDPTREIWLEGESCNIGHVYIPQTFFEAMKRSRVILLILPFEIRLQRLIGEYCGFGDEPLLQALEKIKKRLGYDQYKIATEAIAQKELATAAAIALRYYDNHYLFDIRQRDASLVREIPFDTFNPEEIIATITASNL